MIDHRSYTHNLSSCEKKNSGLNEIQGILRVYYKLTKWPAPSGLIAQLVEHYTSIAEVMGSNPVQAWVFFFFSGCCVCNCDDPES